MVVMFRNPDRTSDVNVSPNWGYCEACFNKGSIRAAATFARVVARLFGAPLPPERPPVIEGY